jgi:hypothetical protein
MSENGEATELLTREAFYSSLNQEGGVAHNYESYEDYLDKRGDMTSVGMPVPIERSGFNDKPDTWFDLRINGGEWDNRVETGSAVDATKAGVLNALMQFYGELGDGNVHAAYADVDGSGTKRLYIRQDANSTTWYPVLNQGANLDFDDYPKRLHKEADDYY